MTSTTPSHSSQSDGFSVGFVGSQVLHATGVLSVATLVASTPELSEAIQEEMTSLRSSLRGSPTVEREYEALSKRVVEHFTFATSEDWNEENLAEPFESFLTSSTETSVATSRWTTAWTKTEIPHVVNEFVTEAQRGLKGLRLMIEEVPDLENREQKWALLTTVGLLSEIGDAILTRPTPRLMVVYAYAPILLAAIIDERLGFDHVYDLQQLLRETLAAETVR